MAKKVYSTYSAAITGGGFLIDDTEALLPMLISSDADALQAQELLHNRCLMINAKLVEVVPLQSIPFDLDDGIIKNHSLFGDIVTKLK